MSIDKIISISGKPGLYEIITQTRAGFLVESLIDKKRLSLSLKSNVSLLSEISIYTYSEEVPLSDVFAAIGQKEGYRSAISHKESKAVLGSFFREVLPEFDEDRVYGSDIKKVVQWYNLLIDKGVLSAEPEKEVQEEVIEK